MSHPAIEDETVTYAQVGAEQRKRRREMDKGWATRMWDWIDDRNIHKRAVSFAILLGTVSVTIWATRYAETSTRPGLEVAAILAAVLAPYMTLQAAGLKFFFEGK